MVDRIEQISRQGKLRQTGVCEIAGLMPTACRTWFWRLPIRLFAAFSILDAFCQRDQAKQNDDADKADTDAYDHFAPYHAEAHADPQRQSANHTDDDGQDRFAGNMERLLMLHLSPDDPCDKPKRKPTQPKTIPG